MALGIIMEWDSGFDPDTYAEISRRAGTETAPADGCLSHAAGVSENGGGHLIEVWESPEKAGAFAELTAPLVAELGFPPPTKVTSFDVLKFTTTT